MILWPIYRFIRYSPRLFTSVLFANVNASLMPYFQKLFNQNQKYCVLYGDMGVRWTLLFGKRSSYDWTNCTAYLECPLQQVLVTGNPCIRLNEHANADCERVYWIPYIWPERWAQVPEIRCLSLPTLLDKIASEVASKSTGFRKWTLERIWKSKIKMIHFISTKEIRNLAHPKLSTTWKKMTESGVFFALMLKKYFCT